MTLQKAVQANDGKVVELFDKLQDTSDQAVKTREKLFADLSRELRLHAEIEQKHLFPALRGNEETKELATEAAKTNRELRSKLDELDELPKGDESFLPRLGELRKLFDDQLREERKELAAARKVLSDEEVKALADKIEARRTQADEEQRAEAEAKREAARLENEQAKVKQAASEAVDTTKDSARELGKSAAAAARHGAEAAKATTEKAAIDVAQRARKVREDAADTVHRVREQAEDTVAVYRETARERGRDVKAVGSALRAFGKAGSEVGTVIVNSVKRTGRDMVEMGKQIRHDPRQFGRAQRDYAAASTRNLLETTNEVLQILRSASAAGRQPVEQRLRAVS